jgi:site-specific DNA-adenine methylase
MVLTKQQGATMTDKNLINLIKYLQEKVDSLEKEIAQLKGEQND